MRAGKSQRGKDFGGKVLGHLRQAIKNRIDSKSEDREMPSEVREQYERNQASQAMQGGCHVPKV